MKTLLRHEKKYRVPLRALPALRAELRALLRPDPHEDATAAPGYRIRSLYFDSWSQTSLREKLAGLHDRFKLRVRGYPPLDRASQLVLEIKRKHGEAVVKERAAFSADELDLLLAWKHGELLAARPDDAVLRRFVAARASSSAAIPLLIEYRREAFEHPADHVYLRATLDHTFWASPSGDLLAEPSPRGQRFGTGEAILEVKTSGSPPSWLAPLVRKHELDPKALSKFAFGAERTYARPRGR